MPPIRPVVAFVASLTEEPTFDAAELAELVTLLRPSDAFDEASAALSLTAPAASDVFEALRMPARRTANVLCRSAARDAARDIVAAIG
jgi:hypothetical protein